MTGAAQNTLKCGIIFLGSGFLYRPDRAEALRYYVSSGSFLQTEGIKSGRNKRYIEIKMREYELIRSGRKTLGIEIKGKRVIVRAPLRTPAAQIEKFVREHESWIQSHLAKASEAETEVRALTEAELQSLTDRARRVIPERVSYYAGLLGVTYGRITIRRQRTRWGSCSAGGNLNFNCLLMLTPPEVIDCVVAHEVCHRKEMNHSVRFYKEVHQIYPSYDQWNQWLRDHGGAIMARMK